MIHTQSEYKYLAATVRKVGSAGRVILLSVNCVKTLTKSVAVSLLDNQNRTQAGQGTWKCSLPAEFIDGDQMTLQELMSIKKNWKKKNNQQDSQSRHVTEVTRRHNK